MVMAQAEAVCPVPVQSGMAKWHAVAMDEVILSQQSSEEILEADAIKEETASRSQASEVAEHMCATCGAGVAGVAGAAGAEGCVWAQNTSRLSLIDCIDVDAAIPRPEPWWVQLVKQHTGCASVNTGSLFRKRPLKLVSACSGMLSEAKVLEAGQGCDRLSCFSWDLGHGNLGT